MQTRCCRTLVLTLALLAPAGAQARPFRVGEVDGLLHLTASYGLLVRVEDRDPDLIGIANGGRAPSVNADNGNLNYGEGIVSNQLRTTAELTLAWRGFGAFVRGYGFYDFENELESRDHAGLSDDARWLVGAGAGLQDAYLIGRFDTGGIPWIVRVGNQVVNWGESGLLRFGVDVINPVDLVALAQPTTTANDTYVRQGMLWVAANLTEEISVEGFYQYDWEPVVLPPVGSFFSANDTIGSDGLGRAFEGFGLFSDLGTDKDQAFGLPPGTPEGGFDPDFMRFSRAGRHEPDSQGQFGLALQTILPVLNSTKLGLHFANYHSRFPLVDGLTADAAAVAETSDAAVDARAAGLVADAGLAADQARRVAEILSVSDLTNATRYRAVYPESIQMLGLSFATATVQTGTLISGEISHHFQWPVQLAGEEVLTASLSPVLFTCPPGEPPPCSADVFRGTSLGVFGPDAVVRGFARGGKTQLSTGLAQLFGPRLGAAQTLLAFDVGWVHIHELPRGQPFDADSWGYRLVGQLTYEGVLGGVSVRPLLAWAQDVDGRTPGPGGAFIQGRKAVTAALAFDYARTWTAELGYAAVFGAVPQNGLADRDFVRFAVTFHY